MPAPIDPTDPFRAIADPTRRKIVSLLASGPLPVRLIAGRFPGISRPAVSKHLRLLREAGVVSEERSGRERFYRLENGKLAPALDWLSTLGVRRPTKPGGRRARPRARPAPTPRPKAAKRAKATKPTKAKKVPKPARKRKPVKPPSTETDWKTW